MEGGFLSTMFGPIGPPIALFSATSNTVRLLVNALTVSVPAGTEVDRLKLASPEFANPERLSLDVQAITTSFACHNPSGEPQFTSGGMSSKHTGPKVLSVVAPALSQARTWTV